MWWNKKEKAKRKETKDDLTLCLEEAMREMASGLGFELELKPVRNVYEDLLEHVCRTGNFGFMEGDCGYKAWMIEGKTSGDKQGKNRGKTYRNSGFDRGWIGQRALFP